jgi:O-antigen/teichoic acid export membrane protein
LASDLKHKFAFQFALSVSQVLFPLITYPYVSRILGPAALGKVNYTDFLAQLFITAAAFGIPYYGVREVARLQHDAARRSIVTREILAIHLLLTAVATVAFSIIAFSSSTAEPNLLLLATLNIIVSAFGVEWYMQGTEAFRYTAIRTILLRFASVMLIFLLVRSPEDYIWYFAILIGTPLLTAFLNFGKLLRETNFSGSTSLQRHWKPLSLLFLTSSAISLYVFFDTIILGQLTNDATVGYYTTALKIAKLCLLLALSVGAVLMPRMAQVFEQEQWEDARRYLARTFNFLVTLSLPICTGLLLLAPEITAIIAGDEFLPSVAVLRILAPLPLLIALSTLFGVQVLVPLRKEKRLLIAVVLGSVTSLALNFALVPLLRERGAAIATISTEAVVCAATAFFALRSFTFRINGLLFLQSLISCALFWPLLLALRSVVHHPLALLLTGIAACAALYFIIQKYLFKNPAVSEIFHFFAQLLKRNA